MPLNRLKTKTTKEILWIYILKLLKEKDRYGYEIKELMNKRFEIAPALITPYVVFYKLESGGFVESRWVKNKKYYTITEKGSQMLEEGILYLEDLARILKK